MDTTFDIKTDSDSIADVRNRILAFISSKNEPTFKKVEKAISIIENGGNLASVTAIVNWILSNYSIMDPQKLKLYVKKAIMKGLKEGLFIRAAGSRKALGTTGSFSLASMKKQKKGSKYEKKSAPVRKAPSLIVTKDGLMIQKSPVNGIKRKRSAVNSANLMRSEKCFSKNRTSHLPTTPEKSTNPAFKFLPISNSFENQKS